MVVITFVVFLAIFVLIGLYSARFAKSTNKDYLLAGSNVKPWLVAISAVSTNNSGYMFIGQIGFTYMQGLSSIWLMIGWILGDYLMSLFVHKRLREVSGKQDALSFGELISKWWGTNYRKVRFLIGLITILFLGAYAAAQFKAGGKALNVLFGWNDSLGVVVGALIVVAYCFAGGIRASIWTDAAQSFVMIFSMCALLVYAVVDIGGLGQFFELASAASPSYMNWFPGDLKIAGWAGASLFVIGWLFAGFGIIGQPHIMVRLMTLDKPESIRQFRFYYYSWYAAFYLLAIGVGISARIILPISDSFDPELALPTLAMSLLPQVMIGMILAAIFAATMSTADSQILSCSASLTRDILPKPTSSHWVTKLTTLAVALGAMLIALYGAQSVFDLVLIAWSVLSSAFAPILILFALNRRINEFTLIAMMSVGVATSLLWRGIGFNQYIYEIAPGILAGLFVYFVFTGLRLNKLPAN